MKKGLVIYGLLFVFVTAASVVSAAPWRGWKGSGGWGMGGSYCSMYDVKTVETFAGDVVSVDKITPRRGMSYGIALTVKGDKETIPVHLGPAWYIERLDIKILPGDAITVTGSRVTFNGKPAILAVELKKGNETLKLREENGTPVWAGWRR